MKKIVIIHFNPLELYPPIQNILLTASGFPGNNTVYVFTTTSVNKELKRFKSPSSNIHIIRVSKSGAGMTALIRYWNFICFYMGSLIYLLIKRPSRIMYFETLSSFPVWAYKKIFKGKAEIFIHYHEYTSAEEYVKQPKLLKFFHQNEKYLYPSAKWVSHTNSYRMEKFEADMQPVLINNKKILPNYPPQQWCVAPKKNIENPARIVYVGALSMQTMFTREFANWVASMKGRVTWDIYSYNAEDEAIQFLKSLNSPFINLKGGVDYDRLPEVVKNYDVGVVLYTGHLDNYIYNAPNKLFEYLACGLDVWFPSVMKGSLPYVTTHSYPKVIALDFLKLGDVDANKILDRTGYELQPTSFFCEDVLKGLNEALFQ